MIYKLYNEPTHSPIEQILINRGMSEDTINSWIDCGWSYINSPWDFGEEKVKHAIRLMALAILKKQDIWIVVDSDADGFTSAAIIMNYMYALDNGIKETIHYIMHTGKQHGLEDTVDKIPNDCLVILPDSSTNDTEQMQELLDRGCSIVCMDHHEADNYLEDNDNLVIINNQICDYSNKDMSAAGVVWQVCRAWDEIGEVDYANDFIDLAALGVLSDMMLYTSLETRSIVSLGLKNIKNPFFYYMTEKNEFSINKMGGINYMSVAFYVTPFINAIVRSGTMEEKDLIFKSFLTMYAFEKIESGKRGHKGELVPRVEEAVRICTNVKARQTKLQDSTMALLESRIKDNNLMDNAIILLQCEPGEVEKNLAGLVANKLMAKYQRPCLVLIKSKAVDDKEVHYRGSGRNYSMSEVEDLRQLCLDTGLVDMAQGHASAFGCDIAESNISSFLEATNKIYENVPQEPIYWVDFVWTPNEVDGNTILDIAESKDFWGQGIPEPYICVKDIVLSNVSIQALSWDKHPTLKLRLQNGVDIMKFKSGQEEFDSFTQPNIVMTAICRAAKNEWNGRVTPQLIIEDYVLEEKWIF